MGLFREKPTKNVIQVDLTMDDLAFALHCMALFWGDDLPLDSVEYRQAVRKAKAFHEDCKADPTAIVRFRVV